MSGGIIPLTNHSLDTLVFPTINPMNSHPTITHQITPTMIMESGII